MTGVTLAAAAIFAVGYGLIATEHKTHINKAAITLIMAGILWALVSFFYPEALTHALTEAGYEIFSITVFLLSAMSLVEILIHYRLFDIIRNKLECYNVGQTGQFFLLGTLAFFLSAIVDNLTATIISVQIARRFFWGKDLLVVMVAIVILANAGGAFSPIGDVTTIMLWLAHKFSALEILSRGFLPSVAIGATALLLLKRKLKKHTELKGADTKTCTTTLPLSRSEKIVVTTALSSFLLPIVAKSIHLPPVIGILFGLGITWMVVEFFKSVSGAVGHTTAAIEKLLQKSDLASIEFFIGILLAVSALNVLGVLEYISQLIYGSEPTTQSVIIGNVIIGAVSAVLDNIPLTAIVIQVLEVTDTNLWVLLALTVGTGGSLLAIGSAAGVVAMGMNKKLTFKEYLKIGFVPALVSYLVGIGVWWGQTQIWPIPVEAKEQTPHTQTPHTTPTAQELHE